MSPCRHLARKRALALTTCILLATFQAARALDLEYIKIADTSTTVPGVGGTFTSFSAPAINGYTVAFQGNKSGYTGIFTSSGGALSGVVDTTTNVPGTGTPFTSFSGFSLDSNQVAFTGVGPGTQGIYLTNPTGFTKVADLTTAIPNGTGSFTSLSAPSLSSGSVAFVGNGAGQQGVYTTNNGLHVVADTNTLIPSGTGNFLAGSFASPSQNFGDVAFIGGGISSQAGVYDTIGGPVHKIADRTTAVPGGTGNFSGFNSVELSYGSDAWVASSLPGPGVYSNNGGPLGVIADTTTAIPGGTGNFTSFGPVSHNGWDVAFIGTGSGGQAGLYTTTGGSLTGVVSTGSILGGKTVTGVSTSAAQSINNGNLVFNATFSDGSSAIYVAEQNYNWASDISGTWDNAANWSFGLKPRTVLYTNIQPDSGILITGPTASTAIRGLTIGANNNGIAELRLQPGAQLTVNEYTNIQSLGQLTLNGSVFYTNYGIGNNGYVNLSGGQIAGGGFYNYSGGTVFGSGTVGNYFENDSGATVQSLNAMVHFVNGFNNYSEYQVINSQVQLDGTITNNPDSGSGPGTIDVRNSILQFTNGLNNYGQLNFSFGTSDVFGPVTIGNTGSLGDGQVIVSGNSNVTFYDRLIHNGTLFRISPGSTAIFFGLVSGAGDFTGGGTKIFEGGYSPGNSPAAVSLDGPVTFDAANTLYIELGGPVQGSGYDHVHVAGQLSLDGTLNVTLINGYTPDVGSSFDVLDWSSVTGTFAATPSATQQGILKLFWNTTQTALNINVQLTRAYYDIENGAYPQTLSGNGYEVVKSTTATATISGDNSYTGTTTISAGTLIVGNGVSGSLGSGPILNNASLIFNRNDALSVAGAITGAGTVTQAGTGTTTLTGADNYGGPTIVLAGLLDFSGNVTHTIGSVSLGAGNLTVEAGTTVVSKGLNGTSSASVWTIAGTYQLAQGSQAAGTTKVYSVPTFTGTGTLDLTDNKLIVESTGTTGNMSMLMSSLNTLVAQGSNGGTWTGNGITSSTAAADHVAGSPKTTIAVVDNGAYAVSAQKSTFGGTAVDPSSILVTRALVGDINLDNSVNLLDYSTLITHYGLPSGQTWATGDLNGDGAVNLLDYSALITNYGQNLVGGFSLQLADTSLTNPAGGTSALGGTSTAVPEPASLAVLALGTVGLLTRRRQKHQ